ncbi:uncharacterized protein LOC113211514 isoform X1 [Frankliniella occidentalis]|uniref:Uncharacterized protein LOC113211514 isoform X1 n=1 Tax=Frankliniella occidentalis TaxID=133901 RepID=A0A6J1SWR6_FRAOC|nr:uncharacterized protein LOC113211514 isoform X1 [Frankliniella occidentalis]
MQELVDFLKANKLPLKISISEDGTRMQEKFCYDATSNQIIGPVLPLTNNGTPISGSHPASSAAMIASHMKNGRVASTGYAIMAQPLQNKAPAFCLSLFGTDNKFSHTDVHKRWYFIKKELAKFGVEVVNFASDGDPKLLKAMHSHMFGQSGVDNKNTVYFKEEWKSWFFASSDLNFYVMQDFIHTANKFRTRLNPSTILPIGNYLASQTHLNILIKNFPKEEHGLTEDLGKDKMNFDASVKISSERVTNLLEDNVPGSDGTIAYLTCMRFLIKSCLDESLCAAERIYQIWYCLFFLRMWKIYLFYHSSYNMNNFVTSNLYVCVEIIAHTMIMMIVKFREESTPEYFIVQLLGSQACESYFRLARSMTSTQSTVINFCMKEFLSRVKRIDVLYLVSCKLAEKLVFPREKRKKLLGNLTAEKLRLEYLPNDDEIFQIVRKARCDVAEVMKKLGVKCSADSSLVHIKQYLSAMESFEDDDSICEDFNSSYTTVLDEEDISLDLLAAFPSPGDIVGLDPLHSEETVLSPTSIFVMVPTVSGGFIKMRKTTFCWLLSKNGLKLSSDRMLRVRQGICFSLSTSNTQVHAATKPKRKPNIEEGEWCIFKKQRVHCIGQVISFTYLTGSRSYTLPSAPTDPPKDKEKARGVGCMCSWYTLNSDRSLTYKPVKVQGFINIDKYVAHVPAPTTNVESHLCLDSEAFSYFNKLK